MKMIRSIAAAAALLLASCGGQSANQQADQSGNAAAPAAATTAAGTTRAAGAGGGGAALQPGQWEVTTQVVRMEVPNMPAGMTPPTPPATTVRTCLTPEQARAPNGGFLTGSAENSGCRSENMSMVGGRVRGTVVCNRQGATARATMDGEFSPTGYTIDQRIETTTAGANVNIESRTSGRRVGDCPG
jgi:hypothetical protein